MSLENTLDTNFITIQLEDTVLDGLSVYSSSQDTFSTHTEISKPTLINMALKEAKTEIYLTGGLISVIAGYLIYLKGKKAIKDLKEYLFASN